jgi:cysteine-rich repeat protein
VLITDKRVNISSNDFPGLNAPANITFFNVSYLRPLLLRDGVNCSACRFSYDNVSRIIEAAVPGFSVYEIVEGYYCGNGNLDIGEQCDDGNDIDTDACNQCRLTYCGDGLIQNPNGNSIEEICDDGNTNDTDACSNSCTNRTVSGGVCGDGVCNNGESCSNCPSDCGACDGGSSSSSSSSGGGIPPKSTRNATVNFTGNYSNDNYTLANGSRDINKSGGNATGGLIGDGKQPPEFPKSYRAGVFYMIIVVLTIGIIVIAYFLVRRVMNARRQERVRRRIVGR